MSHSRVSCSLGHQQIHTYSLFACIVIIVSQHTVTKGWRPCHDLNWTLLFILRQLVVLLVIPIIIARLLIGLFNILNTWWSRWMRLFFHWFWHWAGCFVRGIENFTAKRGCSQLHWRAKRRDILAFRSRAAPSRWVLLWSKSMLPSLEEWRGLSCLKKRAPTVALRVDSLLLNLQLLLDVHLENTTVV